MTLLSDERPKLANGLAAFAGAFDLVLCDVWGVLHNGVASYAAAVEALRRFRQGGGTVILITNAPAPHGQVRARLDRLRVPRDAYDGIATSGDVAVAMMVAAGCPPVFNIGPSGEEALYREAARLGPRRPSLVAIADAAMAVCVGLDETGDRPEDYDDTLSRLLARKIDLVCANPDIVVEMGDSLVYCAGAIAERYAARGGTVVQAGKPHALIYDRALALAGTIRSPTPKHRILAIGDAVKTDIAGANAQGIASLLITTGIHRAALHPAGRGSELDAAAVERFLADCSALPTAAMPELRWSA